MKNKILTLSNKISYYKESQVERILSDCRSRRGSEERFPIKNIARLVTKKILADNRTELNEHEFYKIIQNTLKETSYTGSTEVFGILSELESSIKIKDFDYKLERR